MTNTVQLRGTLGDNVPNTNRLLSPNIWSDFPISGVLNGVVDGHYHFNDFYAIGAHATTGYTIACESPDGYFFGDTGSTATKLADTDRGQLKILGDGTDEDGYGLCYGNAAGIARCTSTDRWCMEGRVAVDDVGDTTLSWFFGLCEVNVVPAGDTILVDSTGVLDASEDFLGWRVILGNGDYLEPIYQEGAATLKAVDAAGASNATGAGYSTAVTASTFLKIGMKWNGKRLGYYLNGVEVSYVIPTSSLSFPDVNHLAMVLALKEHTAAARYGLLDWWAIGACCE